MMGTRNDGRVDRLILGGLDPYLAIAQVNEAEYDKTEALAGRQRIATLEATIERLEQETSRLRRLG